MQVLTFIMSPGLVVIIIGHACVELAGSKIGSSRYSMLIGPVKCYVSILLQILKI